MRQLVKASGRAARPDPADVAAVGAEAMISTSHPLATEAGLDALRKGGSAVDAYIAAAAVQTVVEPTMTSLAGGLGVSIYEPSTGQSRMVGGAGGLPEDEDGKLDEPARWSGRTVVPPGWVSGAHGAWKRWGKLEWGELFTHALAYARDGFVVDQLLWGTIFEYRTVPGRYAAGREVWFPDGTLIGVGDVLRQPALARTIEQLAEEGPAFFYRGDFARHYVEAARALGGRITMDDMAKTEEAVIDVASPVFPVASGYDLHTTGSLFALALNVATVGKLGSRGHPTQDPETLYLLMRVVEECWHFDLEHGPQNPLFDTEGESGPIDSAAIEGLVEGLGDIASVANAEKLWPQVVSGLPRPFDGMHLDTNAIVVVDPSGMIAHGTHSTVSTPFGVGLMVDGVIVPRPIYLFASHIVPIPAGWDTSLLAVRDRRPVFAAASPSISAFQNVLQNTLNVLEWGMEPGDSVRQPLFGSPVYPSNRPMIEATFGDATIEDVERRGLRITRVSPWEPEMGSCHSLHIMEDGRIRGAADPRRIGRASGY